MDDQDPVQLLGLLRPIAFDRAENPLVVGPRDSSMVVNPSAKFHIRQLQIREDRETFAE